MDGKIGNKKRSVEKPLCQYGASCYRKNPEHRKKFKHTPKKEAVTKCVERNSLNDALSEDNSEISIIETSVIEEADDDQKSVDAEESLEFFGIDNYGVTLEETVDEILKSMPKDFFDFWKFCSSLNKSNPQDAFSEIGYKLVGVYDLLVKKLPKDQKVDISCHWRYFYDPPEFQTILKKDGNELYHIGYFRDDPSEMPSILASNKAAFDAKLTLMGDNIFCAMNIELSMAIKSLKSQALKDKATRLQEELLKFAAQKKYATDVQTNKTKQRQQKVVSKTFHRLGIVVPVKNDIGYRPLPDSDAVIKTILRRIVTAKNEDKRLEYEEPLDEIKTNVHFANDECDYGMGLELGIDLFCFGDPYFHESINAILPLAYNLLKRPKYALITKAHLKNRRKDDKLSTLEV